MKFFWREFLSIRYLSISNIPGLQETNLALTETVRELSERLQSVEKTLAEAISVNNPPSAIGTGLESRVKAVEDLIEERTNRQLRKTLVIKGVPEDEDEKSWQDCENKLSKIFAETLDIPTEDAKSLIDCCHRDGNEKYYKESKKTRPIYAAMLHWKTCEQFIWNARKRGAYLLIVSMGLCPLSDGILQWRREESYSHGY